jgi:hypothetical protein
MDQLARVGRATVVPPSCGSKAEVFINATAGPINGREQARDSSDPKHGIALAAVPEHFFDLNKWNELVSSLGSPENALRRISNPDHAALVFIRRQVEETIYLLGQSLVEDFRAQLISGNCVATGLQPPSIERVTIPPELHRDLYYNFEDGVAKGGGYFFSHIRIVKTPGIEHQKSDASTSIASWLVARRAQQGEELKKTLVGAAYREFGDECTTRAFDAAYRRVYGRKRGRPRKAGAE